MKESSRYLNTLAILLIIAGVLLLIFRFIVNRIRQNRDQAEQVQEDPPITVEPDPQPESKDQLILDHYLVIRKALPKDHFSDTFCKILTAQAMHETGIFTSRLYREQNNMFGMRHPQVRKTKSIRPGNGFATFQNLEDSVKDLWLYFDEFSLPYDAEWLQDPDNPSKYVAWLKQKGYFTDNYINYFNPVRSHFNRVKLIVQ